LHKPLAPPRQQAHAKQAHAIQANAIPPARPSELAAKSGDTTSTTSITVASAAVTQPVKLQAKTPDAKMGQGVTTQPAKAAAAGKVVTKIEK